MVISGLFLDILVETNQGARVITSNLLEEYSEEIASDQELMNDLDPAYTASKKKKLYSKKNKNNLFFFTQ